MLAGLLATAALPPAAAAPSAPAPAAADEFGGDPFRSHPWADMRREFLGSGPVHFDARIAVRGPAFAEDPMNVPISVVVPPELGPVEQVSVLVDRNPIRKVLDFYPLDPVAAPAFSFRFKLEQASPVRVAARTRDGQWHVGGTWVESSGGGCTVPGATRKDGSWSQTLGQVSGRLFVSAARGGDAAADGAPRALFGGSRLRVRVMHPMDTGLVGGIPAFYLSRLSVRDAADRELLRLHPYEPVSENPVFGFDFRRADLGPLRLVGVDNNGNRVNGAIE
ncbi:quinoprotein dehydrogenase-associated SoxYZ-like carrier [Piscinibacter sakaiensis]|uniref:quinoprotein dehydrogenase-associated SoxYZ-like carrier n=1 Tax=Piscinibacter sakaiensis TaxID=1547922 RepID=UPI000ABD5AAA|nr:quinoprotein dehydrogenase-associated SoxYZ-like carrier [Piscinibacter sakaiensis]